MQLSAEAVAVISTGDTMAAMTAVETRKGRSMGEPECRESTAQIGEGKASLEEVLRTPPESWLAYADLVKKWSERSNLVGAKTEEALREVLFADAVMLCDPALLPLGSRFVDVGAGAGAPAIPMLLARPDLSATLVEPRRLRVEFLRAAVESLGLTDRCQVLKQKLGTAPLADAPFDVALSRATFPPQDWLSRAGAIAPRAVAMVAGRPLPDGKRLLERAYALPFSGSPRGLALYRVGAKKRRR